MNVIDLGTDIEFEVKYGGQVYKLREPSAKEVSQYQKKLKSEDLDSTETLVSFVNSLGMPTDVAEKMPASKLNTLVVGLIEGLSKKN